jgi:DNA invertase Pin-like site-specific DNA recombinase
MRVVAYVRVSTEEQAEDGISLPNQREKAEAYCKLYDLQLLEVIEDAGASAKTLKRPGLQRALAMLRSGQADGLVIVKLDRLTRSVADWQTLIDDYFGERAGKQLCSVGDSIDTRTAAGRLVLNVLLSVAQWERETIAERTRDGMRYKGRRGERCSKSKYGFDLAPDGTTWIPNAAEQEVIALMGSLRQRGFTYRQIAAELATRGIPTKEGRRWQLATVHAIVQRAS